MLGERQRQEALGVGLIVLGLLVGLSLVSPLLTGGEGNWIGPIGSLLHRGFSAVFGPLAPLAAIPAFVWGVHFLGTGERGQVLRWSLLPAGLLLVLPTFVWLLAARGTGTPEGIGWLGTSFGSLLYTGFGWIGAFLIAVALLAVSLVLTLGWSLASAVVGGRDLARRGITAGAGGARNVGRAVAELYRSPEPGIEETTWQTLAEEHQDPDLEPVEDLVEEEPTAAKPRRNGSRRKAKDDEAGEPSDVPVLAEHGDLDQTRLPSLDLLDEPDGAGSGIGTRELGQLGDVLIEKLATFRIAGEIGGWTTGPAVTQFEVIPAPGVKVGQISARADDLALALKAPSVRIVAPIPGKGAVGVEVPNPRAEMVTIREVLEAPAYSRARAALPLGLGRDLSGKPYCADLTRMPHLLIAGQTGSGKSVCINTIITSLVYRYTPQELRLLMVDPKMVELSVYKDLPHLRHPVITDNEEAASVLKWGQFEMKRRFGLLSANACRNLSEFNARLAQGRDVIKPPRGPGDDGSPYEDGPLPYVVLLIDELADLMMTVQAEVETPLAMLAQKARAVGIHLVIATQRPSVNVLTGLIKANVPSRIAFRVASKIDSRTILDQNGAESLLGTGDMLFLPPGRSDAVRIQGAFISSEETERMLDWYREQAAARAAQEEAESQEPDILDVVRELESESKIDVAGEVLEDRDALFRQAAEIVITNSAGSTSLLQRRLKIGYGRAARIIDQLHHAGVVGPAEGSKPREVMMSLTDLEDALDEV
ncbi:MAG: DNA translocase FtsK [Gemmatimonadota bacterium]|nr:DNA translocase FtsK [Gemmatimonadota bacterium]